MLNKTFYNTLRKTTASFLHQFSDITCNKYSPSGEVLKVVKVPVMLAGKEKFATWISNRKHEKRLPVIGVYSQGISFDQQRMRSTIDNQYYNINPIVPIEYTPTTTNTVSASVSGAMGSNYPPVPFRVNYIVMISTLYVVEMEQILEQILPFFIPHNSISITVPEIDKQFTCKVTLRNASPEDNMNMNINDYRTLVWTLNFEVDTILIAPNWEIRPIEQVNVGFYPKFDAITRQSVSTMPTSAQPHDLAMITAENIMYENEVD